MEFNSSQTSLVFLLPSTGSLPDRPVRVGRRVLVPLRPVPASRGSHRARVFRNRFDDFSLLLKLFIQIGFPFVTHAAMGSHRPLGGSTGPGLKMSCFVLIKP